MQRLPASASAMAASSNVSPVKGQPCRRMTAGPSAGPLTALPGTPVSCNVVARGLDGAGKPGGRVRYLVHRVEDVTAEERARAALREAQERSDVVLAALDEQGLGDRTLEIDAAAEAARVGHTDVGLALVPEQRHGFGRVWIGWHLEGDDRSGATARAAASTLATCAGQS